MYDKYGHVDEDTWNYEVFMKNSSFDNLFGMFDDNMFGGGLFDAFGPAGMMQGRHSIKLMYTRKAAEGKLFKDEDPSEEKLSSFTNTPGKGLKSTKNLQFWKKNEASEKKSTPKPKEDEDWETDEEVEKGKQFN